MSLDRKNTQHTQHTQHSPEQQRVIECWGEGMAVLAGAGSGKTTTLVSKCLRLLELHPNARFAAVSFTEKSASDLRAKLSEKFTELGQPSALSQHWVTTIHGLCGSIIQEFPQAAGFDAEDRVISQIDADLLWERALEGLWFDELSDELRLAFERLLDRESRDSLSFLLKRCKDLSSLGLMNALQESHDPDSQALSIVSTYVMTRYERLKRKQGMLDFADLELGAFRALQHESVRASFHQRFDLVLVDEFQDTNPIQAQMISAFARPSFSNLCVVGDPKQSIYRFRDADVSVFEEFCSRLPKQFSLTWNFRSRPGIIEFANQICAQAFEVSQMRFDSLTPKRSVDVHTRPLVHLEVRSPQELAWWILEQKKLGVPLEQMALLVRKIRGNESWFRALMSCGIPVSIGSGGLFWDDPRVRELVAFLRWWVNPSHKLSGGVFLRAPWMGVSDAELDQWVREDPTWRTPFFNSSHRVAQGLKQYLKIPARPGELLMALIASEEIEQEIWAPLLGLWHRVEELSLRGFDLFEVVMEISRACEESRREKEVPTPRGMGQIPILTIHGSKGLEFPYVILIDFPERPRQAEMPLLYWDRIEGAFLGARDEDGQRDRKHPLEVKWRSLEKLKNLAESKRLFYVALTRAKEQLILVTPQVEVRIPRDTPEAVQQAFLQDDWRAWLECSSQIPTPERVVLEGSTPLLEQGSFERKRVSQQVRDLIEPQGPESQGVFKASGRGNQIRFHEVYVPNMRARHSVTEWNLLAHCLRAYEWRFIRPRLKPKKADSEPSQSFQSSSEAVLQSEIPAESVSESVAESVAESVDFRAQMIDPEITQKELGTRVHQCLETGDWQGLLDLQKEVGEDTFLAEPVLRWAKSSPWMKPRQPEQGRAVWTELSFEVPLEGEILVGSIDRVIREESQGRVHYSIIDFKVSQKTRSVQSLKAAYQTQMNLYARAVAALDEGRSEAQIQAWIVNISSQTVQIVSLDVDLSAWRDLMRKSLRIIAGDQGEPNPSSYCKMCEFSTCCPESQAKEQKAGQKEEQGEEQV